MGPWPTCTAKDENIEREPQQKNSYSIYTTIFFREALKQNNTPLEFIFAFCNLGLDSA